MGSKTDGYATARIVVGIIAAIFGGFAIYESYNVFAVGSLLSEELSSQGAVGILIGLLLLIGGLISAATSSSEGGGTAATVFMTIAALIGIGIIFHGGIVYADLLLFAWIAIILFVIVCSITRRQKSKPSASSNQNNGYMNSEIPRWTLNDMGDDTLRVYDDRIEIIHEGQNTVHVHYYPELKKTEVEETYTQIILKLYTEKEKMSFPFEFRMKSIYTVEEYIRNRISDSSVMTKGGSISAGKKLYSEYSSGTSNGTADIPRWSLECVGCDILKVFDDRIVVILKEQNSTHTYYYSSLNSTEVHETDSQIILKLFSEEEIITLPFEFRMKSIYTVESFIRKRIQENALLPERGLGEKEQNSVKKESIPDEIRKYKQLLDDGAITQEEYDQMKKRILGL